MAVSKKQSDSLQVQERDFALLRNLFESRIMTLAHATILCFDGKGEAAKKRLQKLKSAGLIAERPRRAFEPSVLFLTRKGIIQLQETGILENYPLFDLPALDRRARVSDLTIRHELEVMDVKTAFYSAVKNMTSLTVREFSTWPLMNEFKAFRPGYNNIQVLVKPDGFIRLHETESAGGKFERTFFLEVDRSTELQEVLIARSGCYFDYYKSGGFAVRNGVSRAEYKQFPFRILMVFKNAERRNNTAERLLLSNLPIFKQVCLATLADTIQDPLGSIWITPLEYREVTKGTPFAPEELRPGWQYKRQSERDSYIDKNIVKRSILANE
jgi:hypothetical protein